MAHTKQKAQNGFLLFDVFYEDGTRGTTRCPHPNSLDGDAPARVFIERQERMIGEMSGIPRGQIKTILRSRKASS